MRHASFRLRLTVRWVLSFGLMLAAAGATIFYGSRTYAYRDLDANLRTLAATELASALDAYEGLHLHEFPVASLGRAQFADKFVQLLDADGRVVFQSDVVAGTAPLVAAEVLAAARAGGAPTTSVHLHGRTARVAVLRGEHDGAVYLVALGLFTDALETTLRDLARMLGVVWLASVVLTAALGASLAARALRPVDEITRRAARIAEGDFAARLEPPLVDDEIGRMTRLLNTMLDRLHGAIEANRHFAADAAHELRGPLTALRGEIDVALQRERSPEQYAETLALLRDQVETLTALIEDLLLLARVQEGRAATRVTEVSLPDFLAGVVGRLADFAAACAVTLRCDVPPLVVYGDERLLARAFANVMHNAIRHNRRGGSVQVQGRIEAATPADGPEAPDAYVVVEVVDTGPGIPPAERERVFERFYRSDPSRSRHTGGHGLGLAICREVMALSGGSVRIAASSAAGTTVALRLPGAREGAPREQGNTEGQPAPA